MPKVKFSDGQMNVLRHVFSTLGLNAPWAGRVCELSASDALKIVSALPKLDGNAPIRQWIIRDTTLTKLFSVIKQEELGTRG